jgi:hypothetical protein
MSTGIQTELAKIPDDMSMELYQALAQCLYVIGFRFRQCDYAVQKL